MSHLQHILLKTGFLISFFFLCFLSTAQPTSCDYSRPHEADIWTFGKSSLLDFTQNLPNSIQMSNGTELLYGCASICDEDGSLLFFTDGIKLYTSDFNLLGNTYDLTGISTCQSSIFIPVPGDPDKYYLFTVQMYLPIGGREKGVNYSVIERKNDRWEITTKNHPFYDKPNAQKITAVKKSNQKDYWIVIHGFDELEGQKFLVYELTGDGINTSPVHEIPIGYLHQDQDFIQFNNSSGYMKFSPDGSKLALAVNYDGIIEVFDFNTVTGEISNKVSSENIEVFNSPYGLEFSPDNSKLYVSSSPTDGSKSKVFQFDLNESDVFTNYVTISDYPSTSYFCGAMQLGVDGKIYIANYLTGNNIYESLSVINNPNRLGSECNFVLNGFSLTSGSFSLTGLPNFVTSFVDIPHFNYLNHCATVPTIFYLRNTENIDNISWDFGDGNTSTVQIGTENTYQSAGNYTVYVTEKYGFGTYTYDRDITIYPLPSVDLGEDIIYILQSSSLTLDAGEYDEYLWQKDGVEIGTERYIDVSEEGKYKVTVTDLNCCVNYDEVDIKFANIYAPNAFKPTSTLTDNQTFKISGPTTALIGFDLKIFNRWGQLVFTSNDPEKGWDGTFEGSDAATGVYVWVLNYSSTASRYQESQSFTNHGIITLLR